MVFFVACLFFKSIGSNFGELSFPLTSTPKRKRRRNSRSRGARLLEAIKSTKNIPLPQFLHRIKVEIINCPLSSIELKSRHIARQYEAFIPASVVRWNRDRSIVDMLNGPIVCQVANMSTARVACGKLSTSKPLRGLLVDNLPQATRAVLIFATWQTIGPLSMSTILRSRFQRTTEAGINASY